MVSITRISPEFSRSVIFFASRNEPAKKKAATSCASEPDSIVWKPGRRMTSVPTNPAAMASMRRALTCSPKIRIAPMAVNTGVEKPIAVTSASGIRAIAKNHSITATPCTRPR